MPARQLFSRLSDNRVTRPIKRAVIKHLAARALSRGLLNRYYNFLSDRQRSTFQSRYAHIFYGYDGAFSSGLWRVEFVGRTILVPFSQDRSWLDWDAAVSLVAHDIEVKETYRALIQSENPPVLFLDVGANYGMHSLLFLAVGIPIIAFEPNPTCLPYFKDICELNGLAGRWEGVAIGRSAGELELVYPEHQPWLGSTQPSQQLLLTGHQNIKRCTVAVKTLDNFFDSIPERGSVIVKIDVEGSEPDVVIGASRLLARHDVFVIFESLDHNARAAMFSLLSRAGYRIVELPWRPDKSRELLERDFISHSATNFMATDDLNRRAW